MLNITQYIEIMSDIPKTYKKRKNLKNNVKKKLWKQFASVEKNLAPLECVYANSNENTVKDRTSCECCGGRLIVGEEGFLTCDNKKCGIIYKDKLDQGAEWKYYGADGGQTGDPTRAGPPINELLRESSFGCRVLCPRSAPYQMRKIRRYTEWQSMPYKEKALYEEFNRISSLGQQGGLSKLIIDEAFRYHKRLAEARTFRGLNRDGIIAASIYIAARTNGCPRTPKEIAQIFHLDNSSATRGCKNAVSIINSLECEMDNEGQTQLCETTPIAFIERYCSKLNMTSELTKLCCFIAIRIQQNDLVPENTPCAIAAGVIYFVSYVCSLSLNKKMINRVSSISEVTINKCFKKLDSLKDKLIPEAIINRYVNQHENYSESHLDI